MIKVTASPGVLQLIKDEACVKHPALHFSGNVKLGILEVELDEHTAEFILSIVDDVRRRTKEQVQVEVAQGQSKSKINRKFLDGFFDRDQ